MDYSVKLKMRLFFYPNSHWISVSLSVCPFSEWYGESSSDQGWSQTGGSVRIPVAFIRQRDPVPQGKTLCLCESMCVCVCASICHKDTIVWLFTVSLCSCVWESCIVSFVCELCGEECWHLCVCVHTICSNHNNEQKSHVVPITKSLFVM